MSTNFVQLLVLHPIISSISTIILLAYGYHICFIKSSPSEPPLIKGYIPFLGVALQVSISPEKCFNTWKERYGPIYTIYAAGNRIIILSDPVDGIPSVFKQIRCFSFEQGLHRVLVKVLGFSSKRADEESENIKMTSSSLLPSDVVNELTSRFNKALLKNLRTEIQKVRDQFEVGKIVDFCEWLTPMHFFSNCPALYGDGIYDGEESAFEYYRKFDAGLAMLLTLPAWMTRGFAKARNQLGEITGNQFAKGLINPSSFTKRKIEAQEQYGYCLELIGREMSGMTLAMMLNSAPTAFWYITFILSSEKYYRAILQRIRLYVLPKTSSETIFNIGAMVTDPLLTASFQETLRLRTQHGSTRLVIQSTTIPVHGKEYYIREGSIVFMPLTLIHKDPHIYSDVNEYKPERFLSTGQQNLMIVTSDTKDQNGKSSPPAFSKNNHPQRHYFMPFGGGDSLCPGRRFAENEIITLAATILYLFEFENIEGGKNLALPVKPAGKRYGVAAEGPGRPYMIRMRLSDRGTEWLLN